MLLENSRSKYSFSFVNSNVGNIVYIYVFMYLAEEIQAIHATMNRVHFHVYVLLYTLLLLILCIELQLEISFDIRNRVNTINMKQSFIVYFD